jgi:8-oxo-dGTP pyrophosphatase MutT (NUDIX family)
VFLLFFNQDDPHILAIQKADRAGYPWRNQVALPGGHIDENDPSSVEAAYRELKEEMNISPDQVKFLGSAGHFQTINERDIEVFVGVWNEQAPIRFDSSEISRVLKIPLKSLVQTHVRKYYYGRVPGVSELKYPFEDVVIWGVTARILHYLIELIYPSFED